MDKNNSNAVCLVIGKLEATKILHPKDNLVCHSAATAHLGVTQIHINLHGKPSHTLPRAAVPVARLECQ